MSDGTSSKPAYVVTLVHGTFARDADWVHNPQSPLRKRLSEKLGDVEFKIFKWTGGNSDVDRFAGAEGLQWALRYVLKEYPDSRHIVIGHSHGGNVILQALDGFSEARKVDGAVTLATPFINCKARDLDQLFRKLRGGSVVLVGVLALAFQLWGCDYVVHALQTYVTDWDEWRTVVVGVNAVLALVAALFLWLKVFSRDGRVLQKAKKKQALIMAEYDTPGDVPVPFLSVATDFDEAGIYLGAGTRLAEVVLSLDWIFKGFSWLLWLLIIGIVYWWWNATDEDMKNLALFLGLVAILMQMALAVVRTAVSGAGAGFRGLIRSIVFGSGGITRNSLVEFWTTTEPNNLSAPPDYRKRPVSVGFSGLRHSAVYTTDDILDEVADWIGSRPDVPRNT